MLPTAECEICGHTWVMRTENPRRCPRCKAYLEPRETPALPSTASTGAIRPVTEGRENVITTT